MEAGKKVCVFGERDRGRSAWRFVYRERTHQCSDMLEQVSRTPWLKPYEESKEVHGDNSTAVNFCTMIIAAPHNGQCQTEFSQTGGDVSVTAVLGRWASS